VPFRAGVLTATAENVDRAPARSVTENDLPLATCMTVDVSMNCPSVDEPRALLFDAERQLTAKHHMRNVRPR